MDNRRDFIKKSILGSSAIGAGLVFGNCSDDKKEKDNKNEIPKNPENTKANSSNSKIIKYNTLGRTGLKVSDISFGAGSLTSPILVAKAINLGVNYFDTAPDYGKSEITLGKVLKKSSMRQKAIITTKFCNYGPYPQHLATNSSVKKYISVVEDSLKRMNTDYIDCIMVHAIGSFKNDEKRLLDENMFEAYSKLKKDGKVRFLGVSSHGPYCMEDCLIKAIDNGQFDIIMPSFNFMNFKKLSEVLKKAKKNNIGVIAMKTLAGASKEDLSKYKKNNTPFYEAAFKWVFSHPEVHGLVVTIKNLKDLKKFVAVSGKKIAKNDIDILNSYAKAKSTKNCRIGCGDCLNYCPNDVAIPDILRYNMYFSNYNEEKKGISGYHYLENNKKAHSCINCNGFCEKGCHYNIPIRKILCEAHEKLSL